MTVLRARKVLKDSKILAATRMTSAVSVSSPDSIIDPEKITAKFGTRLRFVLLFTEQADDLTVVCVLNVPGFREHIVCSAEALQDFVPVLHFRIVYGNPNNAAGRTEHRGIQYCPDRQTIQPKCKGKNQRECGKQQEPAGFPF
jgi:hypothetical protein